MVRCAMLALCLVLVGCQPQRSGSAQFIRSVEWAESGEWLKGDTHVHTRFSDGSKELQEVVATAAQYGCDFLCITDHSDPKLRAGGAEYFESISVARRLFPKQVLISGLEWNIPPHRGDEHVTVLFPTGDDEAIWLEEFKKRFDGLESTTKGLDQEAFQWLEQIRKVSRVPPVVILNHPLRKTDTEAEMLSRFTSWRKMSDLLIGFEGAPGHQHAKPLGAYSNVFQPVDRWDPAAADIGGVWDQLLQQGHNIWAALAPSDFHDNLQGDDWPGQFSETWVYSRDRTSAGILEALREGTFFGAHGRSVAEMMFKVEASGLPRAAIMGEEIVVASGSTVRVKLQGIVNTEDWTGEANNIELVELIGVSREGAKILTKRPPVDNKLLLDYTVDVPEGGIIIRARGRRLLSDQPDYVFYTNPIRIRTHSGGSSASAEFNCVTECLLVAILLALWSITYFSLPWLKLKPIRFSSETDSQSITWWLMGVISGITALYLIAYAWGTSSDEWQRSDVLQGRPPSKDTIIGGIILVILPTAFSLRYPLAGLITYVATAYLLPREWPLSVALARELPTLPALLFLQLVAWGLAGEGRGKTRSPLGSPACLMMGGVALSLFANLWMGTAMKPETLQRSWRWFEVLVLIQLIEARVGRGNALSALSVGLAAIPVVRSLIAWGEINRNELIASLIVVSLPMLLSLILVRKEWKWRLPAALLLLAQLGILCLTKNRGGIVALVVSIGIFVASMRRRTLWLGGYAVVLALGIALAWNTPLGERFANIFKQGTSDQESATARIRLWEAGAKLFLDHPHFGVGPGNTSGLIGDYLDRPDQLANLTLHNILMDVLGDLGWIGGACFLWLLYRIMVPLVRGVFSSSIDHNRTWGQGLLASLVAWLTAGSFLTLATFPLAWIFAGFSGISISQGRRVLHRRVEIERQPAPRNGHFAALAVAWLFVAIYGSLVPFQYRALDLQDAVTRFRAIPFLQIDIQHRADWVANLLLFIPGTFFTMAALRSDRSGKTWDLVASVGVALASVALATSIEFTQQWFPRRTVSQNDIYAETLGGLVGIVLWWTLGSRIVQTMRRALRHTGETRWRWWLWIYFWGHLTFQVMPLDLTIHPREILEKWRLGRIVVLPFSDFTSGVGETTYTILADTLLAVPFGLLGVFAGQAVGQRRSWPLALAIGLIPVLLIESLQLLIFSRICSTTDLIIGGAGVLLGTLAAQKKITLPFEWVSQPIFWRGLAVGMTFVVAVIFWWPGELSWDRKLWIERAEGALRVPFASLYTGSDMKAITQITRKMIWWAPIGVLWGMSLIVSNKARGRRSRHSLAMPLTIIALVLSALLVEAGQIPMPTKTCDLTDALLYLLGGLAGLFGALLTIREPDLASSPVQSQSQSSKPFSRRPVEVILAFSLSGFLLFATIYRWSSGTEVPPLSLEQSDEQYVSHVRPERLRLPDHERLNLTYLSRGTTSGLIEMEEIPLPRVKEANAIWGALGVDHQGHLWFAVSGRKQHPLSASLCELLPGSPTARVHGDVVSRLKELGHYEAGVEQSKIHTRIVQGDDGWIYFASMDESGESTDGSSLPTWGSHLWRVDPKSGRWEHLAKFLEGIISISHGGRYLYALGLPGHVLYQFDLETGEIKRTVVGSLRGHISRNLFSDLRGRVFVPRLTGDGYENSTAELVELDYDLNVLASTRLERYLRKPTKRDPKPDVSGSHGITGVTMLKDKRWVFVTGEGILYQVEPSQLGPSKVTQLGPMHPKAPKYVGSLIALDGERYVAGVSHAVRGELCEWLIYDLSTKTAEAWPLPVSKELAKQEVLLYGSMARDPLGGIYLGGRRGSSSAILLKISPQRGE